MADTEDVRVSSTIYNLAGPEEGRIDYLKSLVVGSIQEGIPVARGIYNGYLHGPANRFRNYLRWTKTNSDFVAKFGSTVGRLATAPSVDLSVVQTAIDTVLEGSGTVVDSIDRAEVRLGEPRFWMLRYAALNDPTLPVPKPRPAYSGDNTYTYDADLNLFTIYRPGDIVQTYTPELPDCNAAIKYMYVKYTPCIPYLEHEIVNGAMVPLAEEDPDPDFTSWLRMSDCEAGVATDTAIATDYLDRTYSDGRAPVHVDYPTVETPLSEPTQYLHYITTSDPVVDIDGSQYSIRTHKEFWVDYILTPITETQVATTTLPNGVVRTDTTTRETYYLAKTRVVRESTQKITWKSPLPAQWYIYQYESGNADLDAEMVDPAAGLDETFYPPLPFKIDNQIVGSPQKTATRWEVVTPEFGFTWDHASATDPDYRYMVEVSRYNDVDRERWVAMDPISNPSPNHWMVESLSPEYPLYRAFGSTTDSNPGYIRVRLWNGFTTETLIAAAPLTAKAIPQTTGIDPEMQGLYDVASVAFKKVTGQSYDIALDRLLENDNIDDIDYAYAVFGVSLNAKDNSCRKYMYRFLEHMLAGAAGGEGEADAFFAQYNDAYVSQVQWHDWWEAAHNEDGTLVTSYTDESGVFHLGPPPQPTRIPYPTIPWKNLTVESVVDGVTGYKSKIHWAFINRIRGTGVLTKTAEEGGGSASPGDYWWSVDEDPIPVFFGGGITQTPGAPAEYERLNNRVTLNWQKSPTRWEKLVVTGMFHANYIYRDHVVIHTAKESVNWTQKTYEIVDGHETVTDTGLAQDCAFIFPLHETVYREVGVVSASQMATACTFMVLNSYSIVTQPWYLSDWFRILLVVVIMAAGIAAAVLTGGASLGAAGAAAAEIAVSAGLSVTLSVMIGALAQILVGMALSYMATWLATQIFGEKVGGIVGAILSLALGAYASGGTEAVERLVSSPDGWMSIGLTMTNATSSLIQQQTLEVQKETQAMLSKYSAASVKLAELSKKEFGDPNQVQPEKVRQYLQELFESPSTFHQRTLMTGSDIADATMRGITDFAADRLRLVLP